MEAELTVHVCPPVSSAAGKARGVLLTDLDFEDKFEVRESCAILD